MFGISSVDRVNAAICFLVPVAPAATLVCRLIECRPTHYRCHRRCVFVVTESSAPPWRYVINVGFIDAISVPSQRTVFDNNYRARHRRPRFIVFPYVAVLFAVPLVTWFVARDIPVNAQDPGRSTRNFVYIRVLAWIWSLYKQKHLALQMRSNRTCYLCVVDGVVLFSIRKETRNRIF